MNHPNCQITTTKSPPPNRHHQITTTKSPPQPPASPDHVTRIPQNADSLHVIMWWSVHLLPNSPTLSLLVSTQNDIGQLSDSFQHQHQRHPIRRSRDLSTTHVPHYRFVFASKAAFEDCGTVLYIFFFWFLVFGFVFVFWAWTEISTSCPY